MELHAGEGGEERRFKAGEAGVKERRDSAPGFPARDSTAGFEDWKPPETRFQATETGFSEQWDEVQSKRARAVPGE